jgi:hypothetical protein
MVDLKGYLMTLNFHQFITTLPTITYPSKG